MSELEVLVIAWLNTLPQWLGMTLYGVIEIGLYLACVSPLVILFALVAWLWGGAKQSSV